MNGNEFNSIFQTENDCLKYIAKLKIMKCIRCASSSLNTSDLRRIRCLNCNQTFSILYGTIFYKSQTQMTSWFYLIFRWINTKHGIPATDVARELGVTYKTAWRMCHEIRTRIGNQDAGFIVDGKAQMDEMYISHLGFKKQGRSLLNKTLIVGVYEKTSNKLIVKVLKNADEKKPFKIYIETHFYWVLSIYGFLEGICKFQKLLSQTWNRKSWSWVCVTNRCKHKPDWISMKAHPTNFPNTHKSFKAQYSFICKRISI